MILRTAPFLLGLCATTVGLAQSSATQQVAASPPAQAKVEAEARPFLALWRRDAGLFVGDAPYLRFAIWDDGRVLYAGDSKKWGHELQRGKISASRVARLKAALAETGVFSLKGTCYLVPDAPVDCLMVDLGGKQQKQLLCWDEVEAPNYGIDIDPKPSHLEFKRCWKAINHLALVALPDEGEPAKERIRVPKSWYLKEAIQSE